MPRQQSVQLIRTYRTRAYLSKAGHVQLDDVLAQQCLLYNAALEERTTAGSNTRSLSRSQIRVGLSLRSERISRISREDSPGVYKSALSEDSIGRSIRSIAECGRVKHRAIRASSPPDAGKPLRCTQGNARFVKVDGDKGKGFVRIKGLPKFRFKDKRVPAGTQPLQIRVSRRPNGVYLYFVFGHLEAKPPVEDMKNPVGINAGRGGVRWGFSDGSTIERRRVDSKVRRRLQRKLARQKIGSRSKQKTAAQLRKYTHREQIRNHNELHRITAQLVKKYDHFAIEDMSIQELTWSARGTLENPGRGVSIKATINRSILEQTWGEFAQILTYKAEGAGLSVVRVDPSYTSVTCSRCGVAQFDASIEERNRIRFKCPDCGNDLNRSVNAARNILARGLAEPASSAGESDIAGRASMEQPNAGDVRRPSGKPRQRYR